MNLTLTDSEKQKLFLWGAGIFGSAIITIASAILSFVINMDRKLDSLVGSDIARIEQVKSLEKKNDEQDRRLEALNNFFIRPDDIRLRKR